VQDGVLPPQNRSAIYFSSCEQFGFFFGRLSQPPPFVCVQKLQHSPPSFDPALAYLFSPGQIGPRKRATSLGAPFVNIIIVSLGAVSVPRNPKVPSPGSVDAVTAVLLESVDPGCGLSSLHHLGSLFFTPKVLLQSVASLPPPADPSSFDFRIHCQPSLAYVKEQAFWIRSKAHASFSRQFFPLFSSSSLRGCSAPSFLLFPQTCLPVWCFPPRAYFTSFRSSHR